MNEGSLIDQAGKALEGTAAYKDANLYLMVLLILIAAGGAIAWLRYVILPDRAVEREAKKNTSLATLTMASTLAALGTVVKESHELIESTNGHTKTIHKKITRLFKAMHLVAGMLRKRSTSPTADITADLAELQGAIDMAALVEDAA